MCQLGLDQGVTVRKPEGKRMESEVPDSKREKEMWLSEHQTQPLPENQKKCYAVCRDQLGHSQPDPVVQ